MVNAWMRDWDPTPSKRMQWVMAELAQTVDKYRFVVLRPQEQEIDEDQEKWINDMWERIVACAWQKHAAMVDYTRRVRLRRQGQPRPPPTAVEREAEGTALLQWEDPGCESGLLDGDRWKEALRELYTQTDPQLCRWRPPVWIWSRTSFVKCALGPSVC